MNRLEYFKDEVGTRSLHKLEVIMMMLSTENFVQNTIQLIILFLHMTNVNKQINRKVTRLNQMSTEEEISNL